MSLPSAGNIPKPEDVFLTLKIPVSVLSAFGMILALQGLMKYQNVFHKSWVRHPLQGNEHRFASGNSNHTLVSNTFYRFFPFQLTIVINEPSGESHA